MSISGSFFQDLFDPPDLSADQADLNPVRMGWGVGQDVEHNAFVKFAAGLILLQDNLHLPAGLDVGEFTGVHVYSFSKPSSSAFRASSAFSGL